MKAIFGVILTTLVLSGCATVDIHNPTAVAARITVQRDDFKKVAIYRAPRFEYKNKWMHMRAAQTYHGQPLTQQLVVELSTWGWAFFDTAYDSEGRRLDVTVLDRSVFSCSSGICLNNETVALNFPMGYLQAHASSGLRLQISGKRGEQVVEVPPAYLTGFMSAVPFVR